MTTKRDSIMVNPEIEVIIIGAGPIGIELAITLQRAGVNQLLIDAKQIGHTISRWPPATRFFSTNEHVALAGVPVQTADQQNISGEAYLAYLRSLVEMFDLKLRTYEPVEEIVRNTTGFEVWTRARTGPRVYRSRSVVLATGGLARPRLLNVPGEDLPHVSHYFPGPHTYFRNRLLVVGGKNSALEAALRSWRAGATVAISYRQSMFELEVVKPHLAMDIRDRLDKGEIDFYPSTIPLEITPTDVLLASTDEASGAEGQQVRVAADFVLLATGFEADMALFENAGVRMLGEGRVPEHNPETMETNVPGLYVAGTAAAGTQDRFTHFISTTHDHVARIVTAMTGRAPDRLGTVPARNNAVTYEEVKAN